jgi:VanZ family protein
VEPRIDAGYGDKLGHFAAYGLLMFLFCQIYARRIAFALGCIAVGIALEFLQGMTGTRTFDVVDMLANAAGVLLGLAAARLVRSSRMPG